MRFISIPTLQCIKCLGVYLLTSLDKEKNEVNFRHLIGWTGQNEVECQDAEKKITLTLSSFIKEY